MSTQAVTKAITQIAILMTLMFAGEAAMSYEEPDYMVIYKEGEIEYREYAPYLVAETVIENVEDYKDAGNEGFRRLFGYITGNNRTQSEISMTVPVQQTPINQKIAMTVPVQQTNAADGWRLAFTLPAKFKMETAPVPTDARIQVREVPGRTVAVLRYSGRWTESNFSKKQSTLRAELERSGIAAVGEMQSAVYNAPFTPPFMRRNEVMVEVNRVPESPETLAAEEIAVGGAGY
jgi:hypothetical protein